MKHLKTSSLLILFFAFFTSYSQYTINNLDKIKLQEKAIELKKSEDTQNFITRAQNVNVSQPKIDSIIYAKVLQDYQIAALKKHAKNTNKNLLITITDPKFDKNSCIRAYRKTISNLLTPQQFQYIYKELLDLQIEREASETFAELSNVYKITKNSDTIVIKKWIQEYTTNAVIAQQYHAYHKKLSEAKYKEVLTEADSKYKEVLKKLNVSQIQSLSVEETPEEQFIKKAKEASVTEAIANRIITLSKNTRNQIKAIEIQNKSDNSHIYLLETSKNSKDAVRKEFKRNLAQLISIQQFKNLFGHQLTDDIQMKVAHQMHQISNVYTLNDTQFKDMESLVTDYVKKDLLTQHYYGYDKKLLKQKRKVIKFKFDSNYKKKIKLITSQK